MAEWGCRGGPVPRGGPHGTGHRWLWWLLLVAWLCLGCSVGTVQGPALGTPAWVPKPSAPAWPHQQPAWGPWGPWSPCSSSCGDGVALRTRRCLRSAEEEPCTGDPRQYRLCQLQGCPGSSVSFRAMQCSLYDNKPVLGTPARYRWVPFHGGYFGYMNVTKIPAGATHIKVMDKSRNYLALMTSNGRYVLNGDWSIAWPGPYEVAGTQLHYARAPDGTESLEAPGPIDEDLHVMVLLQEPNPSIEYEFWLPRGHLEPDASPLRQPQPRRAGSPPPQEPPVTLAPALPPQPGGSATEPPLRGPPGRSGAAAAGALPRRAMREVPPGQGALPAHPALLPERLRLPGPDTGAALGGAGDALRGGGENAVSSPLPTGAPGVRVGAQHLRLPPAPDRRRVPAHGAAARQLRAYAQPHPAAGRRLRPAMDAPRGPAGAGGSLALPPAPAALIPPCSSIRQDPEGKPGGLLSCTKPFLWLRGGQGPRDPHPALCPALGISLSLGCREGGGGW
ncbi:ADAMTS-like protein 5 isoform 5-T5 [Chlamydotis macqueenii]